MKLASLLLLQLIFCSAAIADQMYGKQLQITKRWGDQVTQTWNFTVGDQLEVRDGSVCINITDNCISFFTEGSNVGFSPAQFNGYVLSDPNHQLPNFISVTGEVWFQNEGRLDVYNNDIFFDFGGRGITAWKTYFYPQFAVSAPATTNGTPLTWLDEFGLSADTDDPDHDGYLSWQEYICGTDPTNSHSSFTVSISGTTLVWNVVTGRTYCVMSAINLTNGFTQVTNGLTTGSFAIQKSYKAMYFRLGVELAE